MIKGFFKKHGIRNIVIFLFSCGVLLVGIMLIWVSTFQIPSLDTIEQRKVSQSTKIYDSTGKILLYDVYKNTKRQIVPFEDISKNIKDATMSIEDKGFYTHHGIKPTSMLRAIAIDIISLKFTQGASTITQQVVKNSILTGDKTPTRKLKELVLSLKLEPPSAPVGTYVTFGFNMTGPKGFCHEFFNRIKRPNGSINTELPRSPRFCSSNGKSGYSSNFKTDMPGWFEIAVEMYEYDGDQLRPDSPVVVRGEATAF